MLDQLVVPLTAGRTAVLGCRRRGGGCSDRHSSVSRGVFFTGYGLLGLHDSMHIPVCAIVLLTLTLQATTLGGIMEIRTKGQFEHQFFH